MTTRSKSGRTATEWLRLIAAYTALVWGSVGFIATIVKTDYMMPAGQYGMLLMVFGWLFTTDTVRKMRRKNGE